MPKETWLVRDVDGDAVEDTTRIEDWDREGAASEFVELNFSNREYYDRRSDIRIGVRPLNESCCLCEGTGATADEYVETEDGDERFVEGGKSCPLCPEQIFVVEVELVPSCTASPEDFRHPEKPARCYDCGERLDNGADHSLIYDRERPFRDREMVRRCMLPTPAKENIDVDDSRRSDGNPG